MSIFVTNYNPIIDNMNSISGDMKMFVESIVNTQVT